MILQVVLSLCLSVAIFFLTFHLEVQEIGWGSNLNALLIVLGGTLSATLIAYPWKRLAWTARLLKKAFLSRSDLEDTIDVIVALARAYRQGGIRALERESEELPQGILKTAIELMTYRCAREKIEQALLKEAQFLYVQYETAYKIVYAMARLAPALGLTGTIVVLIRIFGHIQDPKTLVGSMGIALLSTLYGVVIANLCFIPLSNKLREFSEAEGVRLEIIQEGMLDLYDHENPRAIQYKLEALSNSVERPDPGPVHPKLALVPSGKRPSSVMS